MTFQKVFAQVNAIAALKVAHQDRHLLCAMCRTKQERMDKVGLLTARKGVALRRRLQMTLQETAMIRLWCSVLEVKPKLRLALSDSLATKSASSKNPFKACFKAETRKSKVSSQIEVPFANGNFRFSVLQGSTSNSRVLLAIVAGILV